MGVTALPPVKRPGTHCIGDWVSPRAVLDGCGKSRPHRVLFLFCFLTSSLRMFLCLDCRCFCLCLYFQNTTQKSLPPAGFEPAFPASDRPQLVALGRSATGIARIRYPDRTVRSVSLYRMSCRGRTLRIIRLSLRSKRKSVLLVHRSVCRL
jgi:hypothetical protein